MVRIPSEYQEVEYIESTGTQWIDSGILTGQNLKILAKIKNTISSTSRYVYGVKKSDATITYASGLKNGVTGYVRWGNSAFSNSAPFGIAVIEQDASGVIINGTKYSYNNIQTVTPLDGYTIAIFAGKTTATNVDLCFIGEIYYFQIYDGETPLCNFIPCYRKSDGEIGMYDTVAKTFFTNQGTGTFLKGGNVYDTEYDENIEINYDETIVRLSDEYQEVEWIESTGTQWIDTRVMPSIDTISQIKFNLRDYTSDVIYGLYVGNDDADYRFFISPEQKTCFDVMTGEVMTQGYKINTNYEFELGNFYVKNLQTNEIIVSDTAKDLNEFSSNTATITLNNYNNTRFARVRWYYVKIFDGDLILRNFIPCYKKSSGEIGMYDTVLKEFFTNQGTGTFLKGNDVNYDTVNLMENRRRILLNTPHIESISGNMVSFKTDMTSRLKECKIHFTPVQEGEGTPSPDNVRPITGWDGVTVHHGENIFEGKTQTIYGLTIVWENDTLRISGLSQNATGISLAKSDFIAPKNGTVFITGLTKVPSNVNGFFLWDSTRKLCIGNHEKNGNDMTRNVIAGNSYRLGIVVNVGASIDISLSPKVFLNHTSLDISFPQTIYGGYVDLVKGEVVETQKGYVFDGSSDEYWGPNGTDGFYTNVSLGETVTFCNRYVVSPGRKTTSRMHEGEIRLNATGASLQVFDRTYSNLNDWRAYLSNNVLEAIIELTTPTTYSLTPQTIKALRGLNNLWSNANGNLEVKFWTHINNKKIETSIYALSSNDNFVISTTDDYLIAVNGDFTAEDENTYVVG